MKALGSKEIHANNYDGKNVYFSHLRQIHDLTILNRIKNERSYKFTFFLYKCISYYVMHVLMRCSLKLRTKKGKVAY